MLTDFYHFISSGPSLISAIAFFLAAIFEEVAAPMPLPILFIGASFFFKTKFSLMIFSKVIWYVALPITLGATLGSLIIFFIAYKGGKPAIVHLKKYIRISWEDIEKFQNKLEKYKSDRWALFISRAVPFLPTTVATVIAGIIRINPLVYFYITFAGIFIRVVVLLLIIDAVGQTIFRQIFNL